MHSFSKSSFRPVPESIAHTGSKDIGQTGDGQLFAAWVVNCLVKITKRAKIT